MRGQTADDAGQTELAPLFSLRANLVKDAGDVAQPFSTPRTE
jgi:hypothetical protein